MMSSVCGKEVVQLSIICWKKSRKEERPSRTAMLPSRRFSTPKPYVSVMKSFVSLRVMVPSKSVKKMILGAGEAWRVKGKGIVGGERGGNCKKILEKERKDIKESDTFTHTSIHYCSHGAPCGSVVACLAISNELFSGGKRNDGERVLANRRK